MPPTSAPVSATAHSAKRCSARTSRVNYAQTPVSSSRANSYQTARMLPPSRPFSTSSSNWKQFHYDDVANCLYASPECLYASSVRSFLRKKLRLEGVSICGTVQVSALLSAAVDLVCISTIIHSS